jgi:hypothetical protein
VPTRLDAAEATVVFSGAILAGLEVELKELHANETGGVLSTSPSPTYLCFPPEMLSYVRESDFLVNYGKFLRTEMDEGKAVLLERALKEALPNPSEGAVAPSPPVLPKAVAMEVDDFEALYDLAVSSGMPPGEGGKEEFVERAKKRKKEAAK